MRPIGMFDSGLGGLTVLKELQKVLPGENIIYFGDTAHVPYGNKSAKTIIRYSLQIASFLVEQNIKLLIVACNSASAYALDALKKELDIPVIGVIVPGAKTAVSLSKTKKIGVLGTKATIRSNAYQMSIRSLVPESEVYPVCCPLFVPLIEENYLKKPAAELIVRDYLSPLKAHGIDTILLGCTHYPLIRKQIENEMGPGIRLIDSASSCAEEARLSLPHTISGETYTHFFVSDDPDSFKRAGELFLKRPIDHVELVPELIYN